jgi:hypothetical protein
LPEEAEHFPQGVEITSDSTLSSGDDCLLQVSSSTSAFASCRSMVSNPAVKQLQAKTVKDPVCEAVEEHTVRMASPVSVLLATFSGARRLDFSVW